MPPKFSTPLQRHIGQSSRNLQSTQSPRQAFDAETGQIYTEREVQFRGRSNFDWLNARRSSTTIPKPRSSEQGAASLFDMARFKCVQECSSFTIEHLEYLPWCIAARIWADVFELHVDSFALWRTMASVYHRQSEFGSSAYRYYLDIRQPDHIPRDYYHELTSTDSRWLVALRISPADLAIPDLVAVSNISNLAVLDLSDGQHLLGSTSAHFDERVFRTWAELAHSGKAFKHLRVLMLGWQDSASDWVFRYLHSFSRLEILILTDCKKFHQKNRDEWEDMGMRYGWHAQHAKRSVKTLRPLLDDKNFHIPAISNCYYRACEKMAVKNGEVSTAKPEYKPLVEVRLGSPKPWTHIIDEFPGTRTVWLERADTHTTSRLEIAEHSKRLRINEANDLYSSVTPPPKKTPKSRIARQKPGSQSAALLLADFGIG